ncbi:unnamed protein product [Lactuca saligna]|uniref:Amino acid permease/ SLC12A domain-containing protein n=1 Tax=Lactuca saligna TaxID=75948 RepID=A0AA36A496_LACSI|nr:unnamed protein product [Lactuca saligna]
MQVSLELRVFSWPNVSLFFDLIAIGSAYHYSYLYVGEGVAWLIGWSLILEYTLGGATVARGISTNMAVFFGGPDKLSAFLTRPTILGIIVDPCAAVLVFIITVLLCTGIKESSLAQGIITIINVVALLFIIVVGGHIGFKTRWVDIKFQAVTSTAEEVKNPQRDVSAVLWNEWSNHFEDLVIGQFHDHAVTILTLCKGYIKGAEVGCCVNTGEKGANGLGKNVDRYMRKLVRAFTKIGVKNVKIFAS